MDNKATANKCITPQAEAIRPVSRLVTTIQLEEVGRDSKKVQQEQNRGWRYCQKG